MTALHAGLTPDACPYCQASVRLFGGHPAPLVAALDLTTSPANDPHATLIAVARTLIGPDVTPPTPPDYNTRGYRSFAPWEGRLIDAQNALRAALAAYE